MLQFAKHTIENEYAELIKLSLDNGENSFDNYMKKAEEIDLKTYKNEGKT